MLFTTRLRSAIRDFLDEMLNDSAISVIITYRRSTGRTYDPGGKVSPQGYVDTDIPAVLTRTSVKPMSQEGAIVNVISRTYLIKASDMPAGVLMSTVTGDKIRSDGKEWKINACNPHLNEAYSFEVSQ